METRTYNDIILIARDKILIDWVYKYLKKIIKSPKLLERIVSSCKTMNDLKLYGISESDLDEIQWNYSKEHMVKTSARRNPWFNGTSTSTMGEDFITTVFDSELTEWTTYSCVK